MEIRIVTDKEAEITALSEDTAFVVPVEITVPSGSECAVLTVFPSVSNAAELAADPRRDPLGEDTVRALADVTGPLMKNAGYSDPPEVFRTVGFISPDGYDAETILPDGAALEEKTEDGSPAVSVFAGGREVSRASVNDIDAGDDAVEIYTETDPGCRNLGYATACVVRLVKTLTGAGKRVRYVCNEGNAPSIRVAEKAGLVPEYRSAATVYYRPEGGRDRNGV